MIYINSLHVITQPLHKYRCSDCVLLHICDRTIFVLEKLPIESIDSQVSLRQRLSMMVSPPDSIAILQLMTKMTQAKVAIEVGVFTGLLFSLRDSSGYEKILLQL